ncbi:BON domain-containing protein [Allorhizobium terrae]|uniref:BON domain-containing protein n=1 Tax=Allorhizobium terrae TaxID=1848972 RepID=A0A4S3ZPA9_9HYPH|nr:BON domain-containing protein [Allorhizobium terrae]THF47329.1 BON domain-containing protein [Allorhizobium terrae]
MVHKRAMFHARPPESEVLNPTQASLEEKVATLLASAGSIDASYVTVTASGSVITLLGAVQTPEEIDRSVELALGVEGVKDVRCELVLQT